MKSKCLTCIHLEHSVSGLCYCDYDHDSCGNACLYRDKPQEDLYECRSEFIEMVDDEKESINI
jgi:hypothetical protein